jgi:hypothetical protein
MMIKDPFFAMDDDEISHPKRVLYHTRKKKGHNERKDTKQQKEDWEMDDSDWDAAAYQDKQHENIEEEKEEEEESAAEKRVRLAKKYIKFLEHEDEKMTQVGFDAEEIEKDYIAKRLKTDAVGHIEYHINFHDAL